MSRAQKVKYISDRAYLEFVRVRFVNTDYQAEEKLKRIDESEYIKKIYLICSNLNPIFVLPSESKFILPSTP